MVACKLAFNHLAAKVHFSSTRTANSGQTSSFFTPEKSARYLNPQTGLWLSTDPAMGEYVPQAPINDEVRKQNGNLPGMGGVFNLVNLHVYHYAGNNPVKYVDPDGRSDRSYKYTLSEVYSSDGIRTRILRDYISEKATRAGSTVELVPNASVTVYANNGNGRVTYINTTNKNITIDLAKIIDHYDNFLENIENEVAAILKEWDVTYNEFGKNSSGIINNYFESLAQIIAGYDIADVLAASGVLSEFLESFSGGVQNVIDMYNFKTKVKDLTNIYNNQYVFKLE
jgi:hypothetical protein